MIKSFLSAFNEFGYDPKKIDKLIVSYYVLVNRLKVQDNDLIKGYIITPSDKKEYNHLGKLHSYFKESNNAKFGLENLIELFELVISPKEKVVTGAVYTPLEIRQFIISKTIGTGDTIRVADIACGCGGFLMTAAQNINRITGKSYSKLISENLWGLDIADYSVRRTKIVLSLLALENGEDVNLEFNLFVGNALDFNWMQHTKIIKENQGFDLIVGNPPYVCSRNIDANNKNLLTKWSVTESGHPDLYIPFFQIALENLKNGGILGYITVNTFFKSVNGRSLRKYFKEQSFSLKIIDFKDEQVFKKRNTYTCICIIEKKQSSYIDFCASRSSSLSIFDDDIFTRNDYASLDDLNGWNLVAKSSLKVIISKIERFETKLFSRFSFSTGIATLKNDVYVFNPWKQDSKYFYLKHDNFEFLIEKKICREIINSNKVTTEKEIDKLKKKIIFPYYWNKEEKKYKVISEKDFKDNFPKAYSYLITRKAILANRDKGEGEYETWFAFGRTQGLNVKGFKLFLPHITKKPRFVLSADEKLLFCNGEAIVSDIETDLKILKKILESDIFWFYIKKTSKPYSSGYLSLGKNYLKQFSLPHFTLKEKEFLISTEEKKEILSFLLKKYDLSKTEIALSD